jgi:response regulator RpfG family c-di-GMP phosphodiesterase
MDGQSSPVDRTRGVLVGVDGELHVLQLLEKQLTDQFGSTHEVVTFLSAELALEALYRHSRQGDRIEVVLAGLTLPGMAGDRLLEMVQDRFPGTLRVLLTEYSQLDTALYGITTAKIDRYLRKPWEPEDLALSMASLVTQHRLQCKNVDLLDDLKARNCELEEALRELAAAKKRSEGEFLMAIQSLAAALEAKDAYTAGHSHRVAQFSVLIGRRLGLQEKELKDLHTVALLHDIGKIGIAETLLNKPGVLNQREFDTIRNHPVIGAHILAPISRMAPYILATKHHHEHYDGRGYPDGLRGDQLPLSVWIMQVSDAFDAMTSARPYRKAQPRAFAVNQMAKGRGTQFHPDCVDALLSILSEQSAATEQASGK